MANLNEKQYLDLSKEKQLELYLDELISEIIKVEEESGKLLTKNNISNLKNKLARKYQLAKPPRDIDLILTANKEQLEKLRHLKSKPTRSLSGVAVVAVMTKPMKCPHGKCVFCPGGVDSNYGDTPQSYTGKEPSTRRAIRNEYDSFRIVFNRIEQYVLQGHNPNKVDCIIMGGTFPSYPREYQLDFTIKIYLAMNVFSKLFYVDNELDFEKFKEWFYLPHDPDDSEVSEMLTKKIIELEEKSLANLEQFSTLKEKLDYVKKENETAAIRCIGLTLETRPDYSLLEHANEMLELGTTRVELGIQTVYDSVLEASGRGHTLKQSIESTEILRDLGFKINYHMMIGMPGSDREKDENSLNGIWTDDNFRPDMLKIYPCLVMPGTLLFNDFKSGSYVPYTLEEATELIGNSLANVPEYCRVMRIQRDIPSTLVEGGVHKTNLKQYVDKYMEMKGLVCRDIRSREIARVLKKELVEPKYELVVKEYLANGGKEFFISAEDTANDILIGFCRLRFINKVLRSEFTSDSAIIRELHVYGTSLNIGQKKGNYSDNTGQHKGWGKKLVQKAEEICKQNDKDKLLVISGVGVREYYRKLGFKNDGPYVSKLIF